MKFKLFLMIIFSSHLAISACPKGTHKLKERGQEIFSCYRFVKNKKIRYGERKGWACKSKNNPFKNVKIQTDDICFKVNERYDYNGKKHGLSVFQDFYHSNTYIQANYKHGLLDGAYMTKFQGLTISNKNYKDGELHGTQKEYNLDQSLKYVKHYKNGKLMISTNYETGLKTCNNTDPKLTIYFENNKISKIKLAGGYSTIEKYLDSAIKNFNKNYKGHSLKTSCKTLETTLLEEMAQSFPGICEGLISSLNTKCNALTGVCKKEAPLLESNIDNLNIEIIKLGNDIDSLKNQYWFFSEWINEDKILKKENQIKEKRKKITKASKNITLLNNLQYQIENELKTRIPSACNLSPEIAIFDTISDKTDNLNTLQRAVNHNENEIQRIIRE